MVSFIHPTHALVVPVHHQRFHPDFSSMAVNYCHHHLMDRGDHNCWFTLIPPSQHHFFPSLQALVSPLLNLNVFAQTTLGSWCRLLFSVPVNQFFHQRNTRIKPVSIDVMTLVKIILSKGNNNLGEHREFRIDQSQIYGSCLTSTIRDNVQNIPRSTVAERKRL